MLIANLVSFSHISERNTNKFLSIYISQVLMEKIFRSTLRHHSCLIKLPLLQLHHHTLLIKLTYIASLHNIPYTCPLIKLTIITSLRHYCHTPYQTYIALTLFHIASGQPIWFLQSFIPYNWSSLLFYSLKHSLPIPSSTTYGTLRNCFSYPATSKLIRGRVQSTKTQYSVPSVLEKLTEGRSRIWHLPAQTRIAAHNVIKPVMAYQLAKLVMRKILVALSFGNACNMALESPKLSYHLLQSMNNQIDPLLLENLAPFAWILSVPVMLI